MKFTARLAALALILATGATHAATTTDAGQTLQVPAPAGFVELSPAMGKSYELQREFTQQVPGELLMFLRKEDAAISADTARPNLVRYARVQVTPAAAPNTYTPAQFDRFRFVTRNTVHQQANASSTVKAIADSRNDAMGKAASKVDGDQQQLSLDDLTVYPAHSEGDRWIAISSKVTQKVQWDHEVQSQTFLVTAAFVLVRGKIVQLVVYGGPDDMEWTRATVATWTTAVLAANPATASR